MSTIEEQLRDILEVETVQEIEEILGDISDQEKQDIIDGKLLENGALYYDEVEELYVFPLPEGHEDALSEENRMTEKERKKYFGKEKWTLEE